MDAKRENVGVCVLEPDDFSDDEKHEEDIESNDIFRLDDIGYFMEKIANGMSIRGTKL